MKKLIFFSFFVLGVFSILAQTLIFRELMANFYGNELFSALMLGGWLIWVGTGSLLFSKFFDPKSPFPDPKNPRTKIRKINAGKILICSHLLGPLVLFLTLVWINFLGTALPAVGEIPNLLPGLAGAVFVSLPLGIILGIQFAAGVKLLKNAGQGYFWENLGFVLGGLILGFLLINLIPPLPFFKDQNLIEQKNSPLAQLTVTQFDSQYNFYQNSTPAFTSQIDLSLEETAHLPLLFHPRPQKVLVVGGSLNILKELSKHSLSQIYFLEPDPQLIALEKKYLLIENSPAKILNTDARYFLQETSEKFDVIILNLPDPSSLLINRLYTQQFLENIKRRLSPEGLVFLSLSFSPSFPNQELKYLNISVFQTLIQVFPQVKILAKENIIYLASLNPLAKRELNVPTQFLTKDYLEYILENPRNSFFRERFEKADKEFINSDFAPWGYFLTNLFWLSHFQPHLSGFLLKHIQKITWLLAGALLLVLAGFSFKNRKNASSLALYSMAITGFSFLAFETLVLFLYQTFSGYLYYRVSILIALAMLGLAGGTAFSQKYLFFTLKKIHLALALLFLIALVPFYSKSAFLFFLLISAGFFTGALFPLANQIYLFKPQTAIQKNIGAVYAADLMGAALAGLLFPTLFIPVLGLLPSMAFLFVLNFFYFIFLSSRPLLREL